VKALLIIDLQNDFMPGGFLAVPNGFHCIEAANIAMKYFSIIVASKDWHPAHHLSFASEHLEKKPGDVIDLGGLKQTLWPIHCVQNTFGAAIVKNLDQKKIQHVVTKGEDPKLDSYSAFFDNAHRNATGLASYLDLYGIDEIFILGLATEYCVKFSALDAIALGLKTNVIIDGCRGINSTDVAHAIEEMTQAGVSLVYLSDLENL